MGYRRRLLDYALVALLLLIPAVVLRSSLRDPGDLNGFDQAVLRVSSPLQAAVSWLIEGIGGLWNDYVWLVDVEDENDELRAENRRLREKLVVESRRADGQQLLEDLVGLRERSPSETTGARVIASTINPYFRVVRIQLDRGEASVGPGMPVLSGRGLVGRVHHVYGDSADVMLVTDPQSSVDVFVIRPADSTAQARSAAASEVSTDGSSGEAGSSGDGAGDPAVDGAGDTAVDSAGDPASARSTRVTLADRAIGRGLLTGTGDERSYACRIEHLEKGTAARVGDLVVTTGLGSSATNVIPRFPSGIEVGRVVAVTTQDYDEFQQVEVRPSVDFSLLEYVLIVLSPPPPDDPSAGRAKTAEDAYSLAPYQ